MAIVAHFLRQFIDIRNRRLPKYAGGKDAAEKVVPET